MENEFQIINQKLNEIKQNDNKTKNYYVYIFIYIIVLTILIIYNIYKINKLDKEIKSDFKKQIDDNFSDTINKINEINKNYNAFKNLSETEFKKIVYDNTINFDKINKKFKLIDNKYNEINNKYNEINNKYNDNYFEDLVKRISTDIYKNIDIIDIIKGSYTSIKDNIYLVVDIYKADEYFSKFNDNDTLIHNNQTFKVQDLKTSLNFEPRTNQILIRILTADVSQRNKKINEIYLVLQKNTLNDLLSVKSLYNANDKYIHEIYANIGNRVLNEMV